MKHLQASPHPDIGAQKSRPIGGFFAGKRIFILTNLCRCNVLYHRRRTEVGFC
ncbi:hypothetical protein V6615_14630 [Oscillospiraceae bacterium PP1C4]